MIIRFDKVIQLIQDYWQVFLLEGLKYTLILSAIAVFFGVIFGAFIALGRMSGFKPFRFIEANGKKKRSRSLGRKF